MTHVNEFERTFSRLNSDWIYSRKFFGAVHVNNENKSINISRSIISVEYLLTRNSVKQILANCNLPMQQRRNTFHRFPIQPSATNNLCADGRSVRDFYTCMLTWRGFFPLCIVLFSFSLQGVSSLMSRDSKCTNNSCKTALKCIEDLKTAVSFFIVANTLNFSSVVVRPLEF